MADFSRKRRMLLATLPALGLGRAQAAETPATAFAAVRPDYRISFPHDHGSHPEYRVEWWYVTGWLRSAGHPDRGFQITFFRARPRLTAGNPSRFNPEHVIIAHAAIADSRHGRLLHVQRAARQGFGLAGSETGNTRVWLDQWQLVRDGPRYRSVIAAPEMGLNLVMTPGQPPLLQGVQGYSRKGPGAESASHYYSIPHLRVAGELRAGGNVQAVTGEAWLDHEWSSSYLEPDAAGWDWMGINLADGGAVMAFRIRDRRGGTLWTGGAWRDAAGRTRNFRPEEVQLVPLRRWRSPRTGADYPVAFTVTAGPVEFSLEPLMDDQENDTRATTGAVYWEGAMRAYRQGREIGRGYLELTGYLRPLAI
jgi:predicted secreted hydrolase